MKHDIHLVLDSIDTVGITEDGKIVGLMTNLRQDRAARLGIGIPVELMPSLAARLAAAAAGSAKRAAQQQGASAAAMIDAMVKQALHVKAAGLASTRTDPDTIVVHMSIAQDDNAILPLAMTRDAAIAMFSSLADALAP